MAYAIGLKPIGRNTVRVRIPLALQRKEDLMEVIKSRHSLSFCDTCKEMVVICADCGNNCCNGMTGFLNGYKLC